MRASLWCAVGGLAAIYAAVGLAGLLSPYDPAEQHRQYPLAPPQRPHFFDSQGRFHARPFVYRLEAEGDGYSEANGNLYPLYFFHNGKLVGVDEPGTVFLLGTDVFGRDQLSRILYGGRVSLGAGLLATALTLLLGLILGSIAGFYAGWSDSLLMRLADLFMALPWLYLLLGVRAFLPLSLDPARTFLLIIAVIGVLGWARPARLFRGIVLSAKEREYVHAARGLGASDWHIYRWHIAQELRSTALTQAALLVPQYILAEVTLSFLGLGVGEPSPSWGGMLMQLRDTSVLSTHWWLALPALALLPVVASYYAIAERSQMSD
jgi:peptide/nickel transport system permease protein